MEPTPLPSAAPAALVEAWHDAVNAGDRVAVQRLATDDVALGGPRGAVRGVDVLSDWVERAGIRLDPVATHAVGALLVVEQDATWPGRADADPDAAAVRVATVFGFRDGRIDRSVRYDSLDEALAAARRATA